MEVRELDLPGSKPREGHGGQSSLQALRVSPGHGWAGIRLAVSVVPWQLCDLGQISCFRL